LFFIMTIKAIIHEAEEGGFWAEVPSLPGCFTEADSMDELRANLKDAIQGWMEAAEARAERLGANDSKSSILALAV
jgi:predicted RNase H-like HicB family nuclease